MQATPQQEAVYKAVSGTNKHVICEAVAGSGKTTTAVGAAAVATGRCGFVAYNKPNAQHLQSKLAGKANACTLHSLGFASVRRAFPQCGAPDDSKYRRILEAVKPDWFRQSRNGRIFPNDAGQATLALVDKCRQTMASPEEFDAMVEHYNVEIPYGSENDVRDATFEVINRGSDGNVKAIDFTDMLWLPVRRELPTERYSMLLVDEVQDFSKLMQRLAWKAGERLMILGDRNQAIYGFNGADTESMPSMIDGLSNNTPVGAADCPLTVTFRCPKLHVLAAQKIVPQIEALPSARDGIIGTMEPEALAKNVQVGDLVICRKNAPLVTATFKLLSAGVPAVMVGRDFARGLVALIDKMNASDCVDLIAKINQWQEKQFDKLDRKNAPESAYTEVTDRMSCIIELASEFDSVSELTGKINTLFTDVDNPEKTVRMSSVHRAKGTEADRVFVLDPKCLPMIGRKSKPWEIQQEYNIAYVAVTRAKKELWFAGDVPAIFGGRSALLNPVELSVA